MNTPLRSLQGTTAEDSRAIADLSLRFGAAIKCYFARRVRRVADVEDLTQEVFVRLLRRARLGDIENVGGYLFQIACNLLRELGRRRSMDRADALHEDEMILDPREELSPERILLSREACALMIQGLQELPERARTIFILNRFEDLAGVEIARRLGVSVSTVEKDMMRAIAHLRTRLE